MICNTIGLTTDSFETLYVHGGAEVPEVYGGINYAQPIFYSLKTLTGATSYSFMGYPEPLKSYEISGNMVQSGTPSHTSPIYPLECGDRTENLFDGNYANAYVTVEGVYRYPGTTTKSIIVRCEPNTTYTINQITGISAAHKWRIAIFNSMPTDNAQGTILVNDDSLSASTITTANDSAYIVVYYIYTSSPPNSRFMVNLGSTALPYEPYGYKIPVTVDSNNLFDINDVTLNYRYDDNGNWVNDVGVLSSNIIAFPQNSDYIYSFKTVDNKYAGVCRINFLDENGAWIGVNKVKFSVALGATVLISGKTPPNTRYIRTSQFNGELDIKLVQNSTSLLYLSEPLRKIGNYADAVNSDGTVTRRIKKLVLTGTENWSGSNTSPTKQLALGGYPLIQAIICACTHYNAAMNVDDGEVIPYNSCCFYLSPPYNVFFLKGDESSEYPKTVADFKSYLTAQYSAGTPVTVWYVLAEQTTEQITAPTLTPATGNNTLTIGTTLQPSSVSITGHVKPSS